MGNNKLKVLANKMLEGLDQIIILSLHDNKLTTLPRDIVELAQNRSSTGYEKLELSLSGNPLQVSMIHDKRIVTK